jgi:hypothetical protein
MTTQKQAREIVNRLRSIGFYDECDNTDAADCIESLLKQLTVKESLTDDKSQGNARWPF